MPTVRRTFLCSTVCAILVAGIGAIQAQGVSAPEQEIDTAVDPILQRSETAAIVFGEIYTPDTHRVILQSGSDPGDYDYTEYEVGDNTEVYIDGELTDLDGLRFEAGTPVRLVPHGENSFVLERVYVGKPVDAVDAQESDASESTGSVRPDGSDDAGLLPERAIALDSDTVPVVPIGGAFESVRRGIRIVAIESGRPLSETRFRPGDTIIRVDGKPVLTADSMYRRLHHFQPGEKVTLVGLRIEETISDELTLPPDFRPESLDQDEPGNSRMRAPVVDLGWILVNTREGISVYDVQPGTSAADAGIQEGDHVISVAGHDVRDARAVSNQLHHFDPGAVVRIKIERDDRQLAKRIMLPDDFEPVYAGDGGSGERRPMR